VRVNIDSDGVVYDLTSRMIEVTAVETGVRYEQPDKWDIAGAWGLPGDRIFDLFARPGMFLWGDPYPGAVDGIEALVAEGHEVRIVTSKHSLPYPDQAMFETIEFYERMGLLGKVDIVFPRGDKTSYPADVVIDDQPSLAWAQPNALNLLMTQPWNDSLEKLGSEEKHPWVWRVEDWTEAVFVIGGEVVMI
jgi:hypothetical protein